MWSCPTCDQPNPQARPERGTFVCDCGRIEHWNAGPDRRRFPWRKSHLGNCNQASAEAIEARQRTCIFCPLEQARRDSQGNTFCELNGRDISPAGPGSPLFYADGRCPVGFWGRRGPVLFPIVAGDYGGCYASESVDLLEQAGYESQVCTLPRIDVKTIMQLVADTAPGLVVMRALQISPEDFGRLAAIYPRTAWLMVNHSSPPHLGMLRLLKRWVGFVRLAKNQPNAWFATVDDRNPLGELLGAKLPAVPNVIPPARSLRERIDRGPWKVALVCRHGVHKNVENQLLGLALAARRIDLVAYLGIWGMDPDTVASIAEAVRLPAVVWPWVPRSAHLERIPEVDAALQVSLTDSFNYVGIEFMAAGRPVVGSAALRYLPAAWQVDNPDDPGQIADALVDLLEQYDTNQQLALEVRDDLERRNNRAHVSALLDILEGCD